MKRFNRLKLEVGEVVYFELFWTKNQVIKVLFDSDENQNQANSGHCLKLHHKETIIINCGIIYLLQKVVNEKIQSHS